MPFLKNILCRIKRSSTSSDRGNEFFLPREVFLRIIERERERTNRTGDYFSLVVLFLPDSQEGRDFLKKLHEALASRTRAIDVFGWLKPDHIGVLLPETDSVGADIFAQEITQKILHAYPGSNYEIIVYPTEELTNPERKDSKSASEKAEDYKKLPSIGGRKNSFQPQRSADFLYYNSKRILKRSVDLLGASILLLIFSPVFLAISVFIKRVSPGPAFYTQERLGYAGIPFTFFKFRTMRIGADTKNHQEYLATLIKGGTGNNGLDAPMTKLDNDPQIIPGGNFLRKSCLDELPQLFNVLRGEMSLVGPRPPIPYEVKEYDSWHRGRFNALPGMTGLWQVSGKNKLSFKEMVRLDIRYTRHRSLWLDTKIILRTPLVIFTQTLDVLKKKNSSIEGAV